MRFPVVSRGIPLSDHVALGGHRQPVRQRVRFSVIQVQRDAVIVGDPADSLAQDRMGGNLGGAHLLIELVIFLIQGRGFFQIILILHGEIGHIIHILRMGENGRVLPGEGEPG